MEPGRLDKALAQAGDLAAADEGAAGAAAEAKAAVGDADGAWANPCDKA